MDEGDHKIHAALEAMRGAITWTAQKYTPGQAQQVRERRQELTIANIDIVTKWFLASAGVHQDRPYAWETLQSSEAPPPPPLQPEREGEHREGGGERPSGPCAIPSAQQQPPHREEAPQQQPDVGTPGPTAKELPSGGHEQRPCEIPSAANSQPSSTTTSKSKAKKPNTEGGEEDKVEREAVQEGGTSQQDDGDYEEVEVDPEDTATIPGASLQGHVKYHEPIPRRAKTSPPPSPSPTNSWEEEEKEEEEREKPPHRAQQHLGVRWQRGQERPAAPHQTLDDDMGNIGETAGASSTTPGTRPTATSPPTASENKGRRANTTPPSWSKTRELQDKPGEVTVAEKEEKDERKGARQPRPGKGQPDGANSTSGFSITCTHLAASMTGCTMAERSPLRRDER